MGILKYKYLQLDKNSVMEQMPSLSSSLPLKGNILYNDIYFHVLNPGKCFIYMSKCVVLLYLRSFVRHTCDTHVTCVDTMLNLTFVCQMYVDFHVALTVYFSVHCI